MKLKWNQYFKGLNSAVPQEILLKNELIHFLFEKVKTTPPLATDGHF